MNIPLNPARRSRRLARHRLTGMTLVEVSSYIAIVAVIGAPLAVTVLSITSSMAEAEMTGRVEDSNRNLLVKLGVDIRNAVASGTSVSTDGKTLSLQLPVAFNDEGVVAGNPLTYSLELATGESLNGSDDNGDGLADEARLIRSDSVTSEVIPLAENLEYGGSGFVLIDGGKAVQATLVSLGNLNRAGRQSLVRVTRESTINPRN